MNDGTKFVLNEMTARDTWRIFRIMAELVEGFDELSKIARLSPFLDRPAVGG